MNATGQAFASSTYEIFKRAFSSARETGLFRSVGQLYDGAGRLGAEWRTMLAHLGGAGAKNLNLGRLLEGHANAVQLLRLYGSVAQNDWLDTVLDGDLILGVWGADGTPPASVVTSEQGEILAGSKRYASGLGLVSHAIVPIAREGGVLQLYLVDAKDMSRQDASTWRMSGMRESVSGRFSIENIAVVEATTLGGPGVYKTEPFFEGGIWRCAAVHVGAIDAIVRLMARHLESSGKLEHPLQADRLGHAIMNARTARLWVEDAARRVEAPLQHETIRQAVATASYTRLQVEANALAVMELARRSVGLSSFETGNPLDAAISDLAVYLRQANPDALLLHKCRTMAEDYLT